MISRREAGRSALILILAERIVAEWLDEQEKPERAQWLDDGQVQIVGAGVTAVDATKSSNGASNRDGPCT